MPCIDLPGAALYGKRQVMNCQQRNPGTIDTGFTLVELLIVMIIVGIIAMLVIPDLGSTLLASRLDASAREVVTALHGAQDLAISSGARYAVVFDLSANRAIVLQVVGVSPFAVTGDLVDHPVSRQPWTVSFTDSGVTLTGAQNSDGKPWVIFDETGAAETSLAIALGAGGRTRTIQLALGVGLVSIDPTPTPIS